MPFLLTSAIVIGTALTSVATGLNVAVPMILITSGWAAWDSRRVGARHFRGLLGRGPAAVFLLVLCLWIVTFPAYLVLRERIRAGVAEPRPGLSSEEVRRLVLAALR